MLNVLTVLPWIFLEIIPNRTQAVPIYLFIKRFEGKLKRFFKLRPEGKTKKKFDK